MEHLDESELIVVAILYLLEFGFLILGNYSRMFFAPSLGWVGMGITMALSIRGVIFMFQKGYAATYYFWSSVLLWVLLAALSMALFKRMRRRVVKGED